MLLTRTLVQYYNLQPMDASSNMMIMIDEYYHLAFLFGASQLVRNDLHPYPSSIHHEIALQTDFKDYMYLSCVKHIREVVKPYGHLGEVAPILNDISGVASWEKVQTGLMRMFISEILCKVPIMRHLKFGSILPFQNST